MSITVSGTTGVPTPWQIKTSGYTANAYEAILADTSAGTWTLTLPATPTLGMQIHVADAGAYWNTNNLTIARNGATIDGQASDLICDSSSTRILLYFNGTTWRVIF